jgi:endonuclease YncB( thermonuclease family)
MGFLAIAILLVTAPAAAQDQLIGRASVIDGDPVENHGERIRFNGVDAPESWQKCEDHLGREIAAAKLPPRRSTPSSLRQDQHGASSSIGIDTVDL